MRLNPLHFLTDRQIKLLAQEEGLTVAQLLTKYGGRLRQTPTAKKRKATAKRKASATKKRSVERGFVANPSATARNALGRVIEKFSGEAGTFRDYPDGVAVYVYFPSGTSETAINAFGKKKGVSARLAKHHSPGEPVYMVLAYHAVSRSPQKNPVEEVRAQTNAATAMRLYHSGQASTLQEAWDIVKGTALRNPSPKKPSKPSTTPKGKGIVGGAVFRLAGPGSLWKLAQGLRGFNIPAVADGKGYVQIKNDDGSDGFRIKVVGPYRGT